MVTTGNDYYELLGVSRDASDAEIKSAYKKAARKYHPDNSESGSEELFKKVGEAYDTLKDPNKRSIYDQYGAEGLKSGFGGGFGGAGGFGGFQDFSGFSGGAEFQDLGDIFSTFFGGQAGFAGGRSRSQSRNAPRRGQDHQLEIEIDFLAPLEEVKKTIRMNPLVTCKTCNGKGAEKSEDIVTCSTCNGSGTVTSVQNTILGQMRTETTCPSCKGAGTTIKNPCKTCKGKGQLREEKEVEIKIPAGVENGANLRLTGLGDAGRNGGPAGDLYLHISIKPDSRFYREGPHIITELEIDYPSAALGDKIEVDTVHGKETVKIKSGTQNGETYTLKNKGMPQLNRPKQHGNHYLNIKVKTPTKLSGEEKDLLEKLKKLRQS